MNRIEIPGHPGLVALVRDKDITVYSALLRSLYVTDEDFLKRLFWANGIEVVEKESAS